MNWVNHSVMTTFLGAGHLLCTVVVLCILLLTLLVSAAESQRRTVTESEIDALLKTAVGVRKSVAYRITHSAFVANPSNNEDERKSLTVAEWLPPDRWRSMIEYRPSSTSELVRKEEIRIANKRFSRENLGEWTVTATEAVDGGGAFDIPWATDYGPDTVTSLEYQYAGTQKIDGKIFDLYRKIRTVSYGARPGKPLRTVTRTYWFDNQGRLAKLVNDDDDAPNTGRRYRLLFDYEYDPTIKIEAPIITK